MINLEEQKKRFKDHVATLTDYGNIKILDFKNPNSINYRIRFLFEEDYYKLHISGDLGELTATNCSNMTLADFKDFIGNPYYFIEKINCHSRDIYTYDEDIAIKEMREFIKEYELEEELLDNSWEEDIEHIIEEIFYDFDEKNGIGPKGCEILEEVIEICPKIYNMGKISTGIVELYLLAFELAMEQMKNN